MTPHPRAALGGRTAAGLALVGLALAGCGAATSGSPQAGATPAANAVGQVLPVSSDPIKNASTVQALKITSVLLENNVDPATRTATDDHLEIALLNTGTSTLTGFEVYYTITDTGSNASESYYTKLPSTFTLPAGGTRVIHFDGKGLPDHFPVNKFGLYYQSKNPLHATVEVSAVGAAPQTGSADKAAGGPEGAN